MTRVTKILRAIDRMSLWTGKFLALWTFLGTAVITYEVVMRYVFNRPTIWAHEGMTLLFGMQYILAGAYVHCIRAHVRVDVFYSLWSPRNKAIVDVLASPLFFTYIGVLVYTGWNYYWDSQVIWEVSFTDWAPPYYPVKFTVFFGPLLLLFQGLAWFVRDLHLAITGRELG